MTRADSALFWKTHRGKMRGHAFMLLFTCSILATSLMPPHVPLALLAHHHGVGYYSATAVSCTAVGLLLLYFSLLIRAWLCKDRLIGGGSLAFPDPKIEIAWYANATDQGSSPIATTATAGAFCSESISLYGVSPSLLLRRHLLICTQTRTHARIAGWADAYTTHQNYSSEFFVASVVCCILRRTAPAARPPAALRLPL